ncbi:MAG: DUF3094 family protein [Porticoccaceae bacterium]|nr:DUF3094 family protein [Porticoccaceae bacterium]
MSEQEKLSKQDMQRVKNYLNSGFNVTERKPFRGLVLLGIIWAVVAILGGISWYIGQQAGFL